MNETGGPQIQRVIELLAKLPGLGPRSARRAALALIKRRDALMAPLADALARAAAEIQECEECGNLDVDRVCSICRAPSRDRSLICVVEDVSDLWALERAGAFAGLYHVLGGLLSSLDGVRAEDLSFDKLMERAAREETREVVIALNATVDGAATAHVIAERLRGLNVRVSTIARGVPVGGELDYLDDGTLAAALKSRRDA